MATLSIPSTRTPSLLNDPEANCKKYLLVALGIILLIASLVASGLLYKQIGYWAFAIGGSSLALGSILIAIGLRITPKPSETVQVSLLNSKETTEKEKIQPILVPTRASDIDLPESLPTSVPSQCDISGAKWLLHKHLNTYIGYLATQFPKIVSLNSDQFADQVNRGFSINEMMAFIFEYLPREIDNFNHLNLPIPLLVFGDHWTLIYIDRERRTVEYYDSKVTYGNHNKIVEHLTTIADKLSEQEPNKPPYQFESKIKQNLQPDCYQCGPWTLFFLEYRLKNPDFDFNTLDVTEAQDLIKKYRIQVMLQLIERFYAVLPKL